MSLITQLNIIDKTDSPDKLAQMQGLPENQYIKSEEFNQVKGKVNELVAAANKKTTTLDNATDETFPSTKAVADEVAKRASLATASEFVCTNTNDVHNLDTLGKATIWINTSINLSGVKTSTFTDGQQIIIKNGSNTIVNILHASNSSVVGNRFHTVTGQSIVLNAGSWGFFRFSKVRQRIEQFTVFGQDVLYSLANSGSQGRVVVVNPDGSLTSENIMEYEVHDEAVPQYNTLAAIVAAYPTQVGGVDIRKKGFQVICGFSNPPAIYKKIGDGNEHWLKISGGNITKMV